MFRRSRKPKSASPKKGEADANPKRASEGDGAGGARAPDDDASSPPLPEEALLDALAGVLRVLGDHAFDVDDRTALEIREDFEAWARHALVGAPRPGVDASDAPVSSKRDWRSLLHFTTQHRRLESDYVSRSLTDLRQVIWVFIQGVAREVVEDEVTDQSVSQRLGELRRAVDQSDTAALKREALASISMIEQVSGKRRERQDRQLAALARRLDGVREELSRAREQLEIDDLTGCYARGALDEYVERIVNLGTVSGRTATLYMVDVDDFKWVNDTFGHAAGDDVLRALSAAMRARFRRASDFVGRYGGDEFAVVIPNGAVDEIEQMGEALLHDAHNLSVQAGDESVRVTLSVGAARLLPGEESASWRKRADAALYEAKQAGRDRLVVADLSAPAKPAAVAPSED